MTLVHEFYTMRAGDLPPDYSYFRSSNFSVGSVDKGDFLSQIETVELDEQCSVMRDYMGLAYVAAFESSTPSIFIRLAPVSVSLYTIKSSILRSCRVCVAFSPLITQMSAPAA